MKKIAEMQNFVGCDVSKSTLDLALHMRGEDPYKFPTFQVPNNKKGFAQALVWLKKQGVNPRETAVAMEFTGAYSRPFGDWLHSKKILFVMFNSMLMRNALKLSKGKTDRIDSQLIADYLYIMREKVKPSKPVPAEIKKLGELMALRAKFVRERAGLKNQQEIFEYKDIQKLAGDGISYHNRAIALIDKKIRDYIKAHPELDRNYRLLISINGFGPVNAVTMIVLTHNFTKLMTPRQYAKYVAVAPLPTESGTSVKKGRHVSRYGDRAAKGTITTAARSCITCDKEIEAYYLRKKAEGKSHGTIMNAIKFKLICRAFAVIKRGTPYVPRDTYRN